MSDIIIPLTKGYQTVIDATDEDLAAVKWCYAPCGYAVRTAKQQRLYLHRIILARLLGRELVAGDYCDHSNRDSLDNRRCNLRLATSAQNQQNQPIRSDNKTGVRGVCWDTRAGRWRVEIGVFGKTVQVGRYIDFDAAIAARYAAERKHYGEFSPLAPAVEAEHASL